MQIHLKGIITCFKCRLHVCQGWLKGLCLFDSHDTAMVSVRLRILVCWVTFALQLGLFLHDLLAEYLIFHAKQLPSEYLKFFFRKIYFESWWLQLTSALRPTAIVWFMLPVFSHFYVNLWWELNFISISWCFIFKDEWQTLIVTSFLNCFCLLVILLHFWSSIAPLHTFFSLVLFRHCVAFVLLIKSFLCCPSWELFWPSQMWEEGLSWHFFAMHLCAS